MGELHTALMLVWPDILAGEEENPSLFHRPDALAFHLESPSPRGFGVAEQRSDSCRRIKAALKLLKLMNKHADSR